MLTEDEWLWLTDKVIVSRAACKAVQRKFCEVNGLQLSASPTAVPPATAGEPTDPVWLEAARAVLADVDPVVLQVWKVKGRTVGALLRELQEWSLEDETRRELLDGMDLEEVAALLRDRVGGRHADR